MKNEKNRTNVIIENDCPLVVAAIRAGQGSNSFVGLIIHDCIELLSTLSNVRVEFVRRSTNYAAHNLIKETGYFNSLSCLVS